MSTITWPPQLRKPASNAYNAVIDCDETLLGLVSSASPNFNPGPDDLERTCVPSCKDSLDRYVQNVQNACTLPGDAALVEANANNEPRAQVPVAVVGQVFQYEYAFACSHNRLVRSTAKRIWGGLECLLKKTLPL